MTGSDAEEGDMSTKVEERGKHWTEGRIVVIRPDVPGKKFDPEDSVILKTDKERLAAETALDDLYEEVRARTDKPAWYSLMD